MNVCKAAENTLTLVSKHFDTMPQPERSATGKGVGHQVWLLTQVATGEVSGEKAHRWLSWAQGALTYEGVTTLEGCKYANVLS